MTTAIPVLPESRTGSGGFAWNETINFANGHGSLGDILLDEAIDFDGETAMIESLLPSVDDEVDELPICRKSISGA